ncbi:MAG: ATP-grasp domain-containing protein [Betaproteobacteria bacterium]
MAQKILFLFPQEWDYSALEALGDEFEFVFEGFDIFKFPENAQLLWFDAPRYIDKLARKYEKTGVAGVMSTNEQYGALIAAALARKLGLPGTDPAAIIRAQHKYYARLAHREHLPDATPDFAVFPYKVPDHANVGIPYPFFVKPVKAAHSVLARRVDTPHALRDHLTFHPWEKYIIKRLVRPFSDLMPLYTDFQINPEHLIGESLITGRHQVTVDGYRSGGTTRIVGIVDALMYPGTNAFQRFEYPSTLPEPVQQRMAALAASAIEVLGYDHGCFNVEMIWDDQTDSLQLIEVNPRLAAQFGDLYEKVDGVNTYQLLLDLTLGRAPREKPAQGRYGAAASFVFREFEAVDKIEPDPAQIRWLADTYPDALFNTYIKHGNSRWREVKWLGSYRYAVLNLGGRDRADMHARFEHIRANLRFEAEGSIDVGGYVAETPPK